MHDPFRILTPAGVQVFSRWITDGATGRVPLHMLDGDLEFSVPFDGIPFPRRTGFPDKMAFGKYLTELLAPLELDSFFDNRDFWTTLALVWFDELRKSDKSPGSVDRYVMKDDFKVYRHLVRSCWLAYRDHGEDARFMLVGSKSVARPLSVFSEPLDRMAANQRVISSRSVIRAANRIYINPETGRPWSGMTANGGIRRLVTVLNQLDKTLDPESMSTEAFIAALPPEFDIWRSRLEAPIHRPEAVEEFA